MAIYKRGREFKLGTTEHKSSKWPEWDSNPGLPDCESDVLTTRPRCLPPYGIITSFWKIIKNKSVVNYLSISNGSGSCEQLCHVFKNLIEVINVPYTVLCCCKERKQEHETINQVDKTITLTSYLCTANLS